MSDHDLTLLFAGTGTAPEPPLRPGFAEETVSLAHRAARRRRAVGTLVAAAIVLVVGAVPFVVHGSVRAERPAAPDGPPSLPDRFAGYSLFTTTVSKQPAGRAIALYSYGNSELFTMYQALVVGADRDSYRRVDAMDDRYTDETGYPQTLLSPDGTQVLVGDQPDFASSLVLVDLTTGARRALPVDTPTAVSLLAWSPDGRYVAYGAGYQSAHQAGADTAGASALTIVDLTTGTSTRFAQSAPLRSASFAPDSRSLAVQVGHEAWIVALDGQRVRRLPVPDGGELLDRYAWLPDGTRVATVARADAPLAAPPYPFTLVDVAGAHPPVPLAQQVGRVLGWRAPSRLITFQPGDAGIGGSIDEVDTDTGARRVLSRFSDSGSCELGTQQCQVVDLQLATGLLDTLDVRKAGDPDRGTLLAWTLTIGGGVLVVLVAGVVWTVRAVRRRRRRVSRG